MINIKRHLISSGLVDEDFLTRKVEEVWSNFNDIKRRNQSSITSDTEKFYNIVQSIDHQENYSIDAAKRHTFFIKNLLQTGRLKEIITAKPEDFERLKNQLRSLLTEEDFNPPASNKSRMPFSDLLIAKIFKYKKYRNSTFCSKLYIELNFLQITCPYCNEYPVKIVQRADKNTKKPLLHFDLDHFYPKDLHPYFALSFFNHIPSCKYCNSLHKRVADFSVNTHIHPFNGSFDEHYLFKYSHKALIGSFVDDVKIAKTSTLVDKLCDDLELEERYKRNIEYANINRLIEILTDYSYLLGDEICKDDKELIFLRRRLIDFGLQLDGNKILERPWSKMQRDLVKFIDIHNHLSMEV